MKNIGSKKLLIAALAAVVFIGGLSSHSLVAARSQTPRPLLNLPPTQNGETTVSGEYSGQVSLDGVFTGEFSNPLEPEDIDLGFIDLALALEHDGADVSGFVVLTGTLVFTQEHSIDGQAVGPLVSGTFDGATLHLTSEQFSLVISEASTLADGRSLPEREATRQFDLVIADIRDDGATLVGEYRETIWGLGSQPVTMVGSVRLQRPVFSVTEFPEPSPSEPTLLYLPLITKND